MARGALRTFQWSSKLLAVALLSAGCGGAEGQPELGAPEASVDVARYGLVALSSRPPRADPVAPHDAAAFFWQASQREGTGCEAVRTVGACEVTQCLPASAVAPMEGFAWLSAGTVDIAGTKLEFSFMEMTDGSYEETLPPEVTSLWDGGELLTATAAGSEQFPSMAVSLPAPHAVELTAPALSDALAVEPAVGLDFAWASPRSDFVYVDIAERRAVPYAAALSTSVRCAFPAEAGEGFVPAEAFQAFSDVSLLDGYRFWVSTESSTNVDADGALFTFLASTESQRFNAAIERE